MERVTLLFEQEINIDLPLAGRRLIPGYRGQFGLPVEIYLRLYAVKDEDKALIAGPDDLSRFVTHIVDENAAWRFLRLFTSPETHYLFQKEVFSVDLKVSAGPKSEVGGISPNVARRIGYQPPEIKRETNEYVARRDLVRADAKNRQKQATALRRREALTDDGQYRFIEDKILADLSRTDVVMPSYE
jgi:hypothetical protein